MPGSGSKPPRPLVRPAAPHVQAALSAVQAKAAAAPGRAGIVPGGLAAHVLAAVQMKPGPAGVVQKASEKNEYSRSQKRRVFHWKFESSHLRNAQTYNSKKTMTEAAVDKYKARSVGRNTLVFMTPYEAQVFLEQKHTYIGQDDEWPGYDVFESTTQFAAADVSSSGSIRIYSAATFRYGAYYDEDQGVYVVEHMKGISSGTLM